MCGVRTVYQVHQSEYRMLEINEISCVARVCAHIMPSLNTLCKAQDQVLHLPNICRDAAAQGMSLWPGRRRLVAACCAAAVLLPLLHTTAALRLGLAVW